jgi:hypothetical protein
VKHAENEDQQVKSTYEIRSVQQAINLRAFRWAYEQEGLSMTAKAVLLTFAVHANERGYTWPGVSHIAATWCIDPTTVRRQIRLLLVRRLICRTKKRVGMTGQGKVYRMPKITYERRAQCTTNNDNDEQSSSELIPKVRSTHAAQSNGSKDQFVSEGYQNHHQDQPAQSHVKWGEFSAWCRSKRDKRGNPGTPTEQGFWKWLKGQKPQWRNKVRQKFDGEEGYELAGNFFTRDEANQRGAKDPKLIEQFRKAVRRNGKIQIIPP